MSSTVLCVNLPYPSQRRLPNHIHLRQLVVTEETEQEKVLQSLLIIKIRDFSLPWFGNTNAMVNIAIFYHNQHRLKQEGRPCIDISERLLQEMHRLFRVAADLDEASVRYYMGELLLEQGEQAQAIRYLEFSSGSITLGVSSAFIAVQMLLMYAVAWRRTE